MNFFSRIFLGVLTINFSSLCFSQDTSERQLYNLLSPIKSFSVNFSQQLMDEQGTTFQSLSGRLHAQKPNRVHWTVFEPAAQKIVSNGLRLWIYDPDLEQVIIQPFVEDIATSPVSLFSGNLEGLNKAYLIADRPTENPALKSYLLTPKSTGTLYSHLQIDFVEQIPKAIEFVDSLGQTTNIDLHNVALNPQLSDDLFTFEIPAGVDVIDTVNKNAN